jgi:hypothetical protein
VRWAARPGVHVDRAACAWLIRRFVDPEAEFVFVDDMLDVPRQVTPFDMRGVPLSHHDGRCSFETLVLHFELNADPALEEIGRIVHEADLHDDVYDAPAAADRAPAGLRTPAAQPSSVVKRQSRRVRTRSRTISSIMVSSDGGHDYGTRARH